MGTAKPIVVTGATGTVGSEVVAQLLSEGVTVRAAVRDPSKVAPQPGLEVVAFDTARPETHGPVMAGADHLFLLTPFAPDAVALSRATVDAAQAGGIEHVVKLSVIGAGDEAAIAIARWHTECERHLEQSGMGFTHLRPNSFMQNYVVFHGGSIKEQNAIYLPHGAGQMSLVDARDIAAVAVRALLEPGHMGKAYTLTGPAAYGNSEVASILTELIGRTIDYVDVPDEAARQAMLDMGSPGTIVNALMELNHLIRDGGTAAITDTVEAVTGRPARSFEDFARDHVSAW